MAAYKRHGKHGQRKRKNKQKNTLVNKKKKTDFGQPGGVQPVEIKEGAHRRYQKVEDDAQEKNEPYESSSSSETESEEENAYLQLVSTVKAEHKASSGSETCDSEEEMESESDNEDSDDDDDASAESFDKLAQINKTNTKTDDISNNSDVEKSLNVEDHSDCSDDESIHNTDTEVSDDKNDEDDVQFQEKDPFSLHFEKELPEDFVDSLSSSSSWIKEDKKLSGIGNGLLIIPKNVPETFITELSKDKDLVKLHVKKKLCQQLYEVNKKCAPELKETEKLTHLQQQLFGTMNTYQDMFYSMRDYKNGEEIRLTYCLHALNHVLKTRSRIIAHNAKMKSKSSNVLEEYRDQGLTRPKVLIVVPFRDSALRIVNIMIKLLMPKDQTFVTNKKKFKSEFGYKEDESLKGKKPEDFEATFKGNIDDHFRIGVGVAKKSLKLYTEFYSCDIIIASPLGLRTAIGAEGEPERNFDFLSSIEMLILDQADVLLMQNWEHIMHLMSHMHLQPNEPHGVDFSRVRMWTLNGWAKFYRQTLLFSSISCPEITSLFNKQCHNYAGKLTVMRPPSVGTISQVVVQLPQVFQRISCSTYSQLAETRLEYFLKKVMPHYKESVMAQTLICIPSYFDYVRIRNFFKKEEIHCEFLCEYTNDKGISRARHFFFHGNAQFMLYTERLHFYRRFRIRGVRHIIFYELPRYPHFYSEMCNMLQDPKQKQQQSVENLTCTVLYTKYEAQKLAEIVGSERARLMLNSEKLVHMFTTGESS